MINKFYLLTLLLLTRLLIYSQTNPYLHNEPDSGKYYLQSSERTISGNNSALTGILFSPDSRYLVFSTYDCRVRILEIPSGKLIHNLKFASQIWAMCYSSDCRYLAVYNLNKNLEIVDLSRDTLFCVLDSNKTIVTCMSFSPDDKYLAVGHDDGTIIIWDMTARKKYKLIKEHSGFVTAVSFSPDTQIFASGDRDGNILIRNIDDYIAFEHKTYLSPVSILSFSPINRQLFCVFNDGSVFQYDFYKRIMVPLISSTWIRGDGQRTYYASQGDIIAQLSDNADRIEIKSLKNYRYLGSLQNIDRQSFFITLSPNGQYLVTVATDNTISLWDISQNKFIKYLGGHSGGIDYLALTNDGKKVISHSDDGTIRTWDILTGLPISGIDINNKVNQILLHPKSDSIIISSSSNIVSLLDISNNKNILKIFGHFSKITKISVSSNGKYLATGDNTGRIILWNLPSRKTLNGLYRNMTEYNEIKTEPFISSFFPKTTYFSKMYGDSKLDGNIKSITALTFSPNERFVACSGFDNMNNVVRIWKMDGISIQSNILTQNVISTLQFSADGKYLAGGGTDNSIRIWETDTGKEKNTLSGHLGRINSMIFFQENNYLASGADDGLIKIWDLNQGTEIYELKGHTQSVTSLCLFPDNFLIISGSKDSSIKIWSLGHYIDDFTIASLKYEMQKVINEVKLFFPKDEFETQLEYEKRLAEAQKMREEIRKVCEEKILQASNARIEKLKRKGRDSLSNVELKVDWIGNYNADKEQFPIRIQSVIDTIVVPRIEARSFKENISKVGASGQRILNPKTGEDEYFNIIVYHPLTRSKYTFGKQYNLSNVPVELIPDILTNDSLAVIELSASLQEPSGNNILDGNEKGKIIVMVNNISNTSAKEINIELAPIMVDSNLTYSNSKYISEILNHKSEKIEFDIKANKFVGKHKNQFKIHGNLKNGIVSRNDSIIVETLPYFTSNLILSYYRYSKPVADNGINGKCLLEVQAGLKNTGRGNAHQINIKVDLPDKVTISSDALQNISYDMLKPGETIDISFSISYDKSIGNTIILYLNFKDYLSEGKIPLKISI